jgi:hypothetical protein
MLASGGRLTRDGDVGFATRVGPKVQTVLGLSMTSTSVGWVLLDSQGPDATALDHDAFDVQSGGDGTEDDVSAHAAAARGAQAIAAASGHKLGTVQMTWTEDVESAATTLLKSLADLGFDNVQAISLNKAAQAWGIEIGRNNEHTKTGLCILEPDVATVMIVATGAGSVRTAVTDTRETTEDLVEWLRTVFRRDGWLPEGLYLVGALADLDEVTQPIADALPIPVSDSVDTQLALARGAALASVDSLPAAETSREQPWRVSVKKSAIPADAETVVALPVTQADTGTAQEAETPRSEPHVDAIRRERPWLVVHARKLTISAAAVAVFGAALSLAAGSALNVENASMQAAETADSAASVTSASVRTVPPPAQPAPQLQPLAAEPPPAPPPAPPPPPETLTLPAEPAAVVAPEPVAVPVPHHAVSASPPAGVAAAAPAAPGPAVPVAVPAVPPPAAPLALLPAAPPPAAPLALPAAPPAAAPLAAEVAPPPAAPLAAEVAPPPAAPVAAAPALIVLPPAAPASSVPPSAPQGPADAPPPPDPIQAALSPLFGGLP